MQDMRRPAPRLWRDPSVRARLLLTFLSLNMLAGFLACGVMIWNAREATRVEMRASIEIAERFVKETLIRFGPSTSGGAMLTNLPLHLNLVRHVRMAILDNAGDVKVLLPEGSDEGEDEEGDGRAPLWFARLLSMHVESRHVPVVAEGRRVGTVVIMGEPADEAAEVWQDIRVLAIMTPCINALIFLLFYFSLGRILNPLVSFSDGLKHLENGDYRSRLPRPGIREMAAVADRFNALAAVLEEAREENSRLYRALLSIQDEERKQIAADLHNEFGQCLFGIKANASSIAVLTGGLEAGKAEAVAERVRSIASITERLQSMNRRLLRKLRPSAFGHASLGELLEDLVLDFRRNHDGIVFRVQTGALQRSYGEAIDLSVYRCVQEGLTNSVRHASAKTIEVLIEDQGAEVGLRIEIRDDGQGFSAVDLAGFGLRSMRERVRSLGGECVIQGAKSEGTRLLITLPHPAAAFTEEVA